MNNTEYSKLREALYVIVKYERCHAQINENNEQIKQIKYELMRLEKVRASKRPPRVTARVIFAIIFCAIGLFLGQISWYIGGVPMGIGLILLISAPFAYCRACNKIDSPVYQYRTTVYEPQTKRLINEIDMAKKELDMISDDLGEIMSFLPLKYREKFPIAHMIVSFKKGKATNLEEAIEVYESEAFSVDKDIMEQHCAYYVEQALD